MTRAAERLVIAGFHGARGKAKDCWYDMARAGLDGVAVAAPAHWSPEETIWWLGETRSASDEASAEPPRARVSPPPWLTARAALERVPSPLSPSRAIVGPLTGDGDPTRKNRIEGGRVSHSLLQYLPGIAIDRRADAARRFLARRGAALPLDEQEAILTRALAVIEDPRLAPLFGPNSRAEVAVAAELARPGFGPTPFLGRIDRVAITADEVQIADFKSGAPRGKTIPEPYLAQLALYRAALAPLYPGRPLRAYIVWLDAPDIVEAEPGLLDAVFAKLLVQM
jgi:ATP-dependent helicase/nuclease subunit A